MFTLGGLLQLTKAAPVFALLFPTVMVMYQFSQNIYILGCILGEFFTNPSIHPDVDIGKLFLRSPNFAQSRPILGEFFTNSSSHPDVDIGTLFLGTPSQFRRS
jgi:hypothetical protein